MSSFMDVFKLDRETVWHWVNFVDGRMTFKPNLFRGRNTSLRVAEIGSSSHFRIYLEARVSKVLQIHVLIHLLLLIPTRFLRASSDYIGFYFGGVKVIHQFLI